MFLYLAQWQHVSSAERWKMVLLDFLNQILACVIIRWSVLTSQLTSGATFKRWNVRSKNSLCKPKQLPDANPLTHREQWQLNKSAGAAHNNNPTRSRNARSFQNEQNPACWIKCYWRRRRDGLKITHLWWIHTHTGIISLNQWFRQRVCHHKWSDSCFFPIRPVRDTFHCTPPSAPCLMETAPGGWRVF